MDVFKILLSLIFFFYLNSPKNVNICHQHMTIIQAISIIGSQLALEKS